MRNIFLLVLAVLLISGCTTAREKKAGETLRNIHNLTLAVKKPEANVSKDEALAVIEKVTEVSPGIIDPDHKGPATVSVSDIIADKDKSLKKIVTDAATEPVSDWGWLATIGSGILIAVGMAGKMLGPPWNIGGALAEGLGRRLVPKYEETKKAAIGLIVATDQVLTDYGAMLDAFPELKKSLTEKLGEDPVGWFKKKLQKANTDNGTEPAIAAMMELLKSQMTTENGVLKPHTEEVDKMLAGYISNLK